MKSKTITLMVLVAIVTITLASSGCCSWLSLPGQISDGAAQVAGQTLNPAQIQKKYESFKKTQGDIEFCKAEIIKWDKAKKGIIELRGNDTTKWDSYTNQQYNDYDLYLQGNIAKYNELVTQYNVWMIEWNYAFCNQLGDPYGVQGYTPLPREYRKYITSVDDIL